MFILNRKTKVIQECNNKDVIKVCQKDIKNYTVAATKAELEKEVLQNKENEPTMSQEKEYSIEEAKAVSVNNSERTGDDFEKLTEEEKTQALESMKIGELKNIAKEKGIQGYRNMNKDTLVAMIVNH